MYGACLLDSKVQGFIGRNWVVVLVIFFLCVAEDVLVRLSYSVGIPCGEPGVGGAIEGTGRDIRPEFSRDTIDV